MSDAAYPNNPYRGLYPFASHDALDFFGRDALAEQLADTVEQTTLLVLVGNTGSGKTSLIEAGLLPALHERALEQQTTWLMTRLTLTATPLVALEQALLAVSDTPFPELSDVLNTPFGLVAAAEWVLGDPAAQLLLLVDDAERLFAADVPAAQRDSLLELLTHAGYAQPSPLHMVLLLDEAAYAQALAHPEFGALLPAHTLHLPPLSADDLERAITMPALRADTRVEPALVARLVADVQHEPMALPWLQAALSELFDRRTPNGMTLAVYESMNGLRGTLASRADAVYDALTPAQQQLSHALFMQLVERQAAGGPMLRSVMVTEDKLPVVAAFAAARLLLVEASPTTDRPLIRIPHEVLVQAWDRLHGWLNAADAPPLPPPDIISVEPLVDEPPVPAAARSQTGAYGVVLLLTLGLVAALAFGLNALSENQNAQALAAIARTQVAVATMAQGQALVQAATATAAQGAAIQLAITATVAQGQAQMQATAASEARATSDANSAALQSSMETLRSLNLADSALQALASGDVDSAIAFIMVAMEQPQPPPEALTALATIAPAVQTAHLLQDDTPIRAFAFYRDGSQLVTGTGNGRLTVWDTRTGTASGTVETGLSLTALSDTGHARIAVGDAAGYLRVIGLASRLNDTETVRHTAAITAIVTTTSEQIITASADGGIVMGAAHDNALIRVLLHDAHPITTLALSPDETALAFGTGTGDLGVIDLTTGAMRWRLSAADTALTDLAWHDQTLVTVGVNGLIRLWDARLGLGSRTMTTGSPLVAVAFNADGSRFITADGTLSVTWWDTASGQRLEQKDGPQQAVTALALNPQTSTLAALTADGVVRLWLTQSIPLAAPLVLTDARGQAQAAVFSAHDERLYTAALMPADQPPNADIMVWDWQTGVPVSSLSGHRDSVTSLAVNPVTGDLLSGSRDRTLILWDAASGTITQRYSGHTDGIEQVAFSPDGTQILSTARDSTAIVWDTVTGRISQRLIGHQGAVNAGVFSPDGSQIMTGGEDGRVLVWDARSGQIVRELSGHTGPVRSLALSPDGRTLLSGSDDQTTIVWDAISGTLLGRSDAQQAPITVVAYNADGTRFVSGAADGSLLVWDATSGDALGQFLVAQDAVTSATFSASGAWLAATYASGQTRVYALERATVLDWIRQHVYLRPLTCPERRRFALTLCTSP